MHEFDSGPVQEPFAQLARESPGAEVYPAKDFRVEWGPIFHRGRLDGTARLLVIGQDPAQSEAVVRRILVGEAGHRAQGLMARLGFDRSYVLVNTFLYSVYGQQGGEHHATDEAIAGYRHRWLEAIFQTSTIEAVLALGSLAHGAWQTWLETPVGKTHAKAHYCHVRHPTWPESSTRKDKTKKPKATKELLEDWTAAVEFLFPKIAHRDLDLKAPQGYGDTWADGDRIAIPERDFPAGLPEWMRTGDGWADRMGKDAAEKRLNITITVPDGVV